MKDYIVEIEGFLLGRYRAKGATIPLTEKQARTFLDEGRLSVKGAAPKPKAGKSEKADG